MHIARILCMRERCELVHVDADGKGACAHCAVKSPEAVVAKCHGTGFRLNVT
jgi:hypothetical protein